jgi:hypothetical protein
VKLSIPYATMGPDDVALDMDTVIQRLDAETEEELNDASEGDSMY